MQTPIITLDEETLKGELKDLVRKTVEEVINGILEAEADEMVNAQRGTSAPTRGRPTGAATTRAACSRRRER